MEILVADGEQTLPLECSEAGESGSLGVLKVESREVVQELHGPCSQPGSILLATAVESSHQPVVRLLKMANGVSSDSGFVMTTMWPHLEVV